MWSPGRWKIGWRERKPIWCHLYGESKQFSSGALDVPLSFLYLLLILFKAVHLWNVPRMSNLIVLLVSFLGPNWYRGNLSNYCFFKATFSNVTPTHRVPKRLFWLFIISFFSLGCQELLVAKPVLKTHPLPWPGVMIKLGECHHHSSHLSAFWNHFPTFPPASLVWVRCPWTIYSEHLCPPLALHLKEEIIIIGFLVLSFSN